MKIEIPSFDDGGKISRKHAFCIPAEEGHVTLGQNTNPNIKWCDIPEGTNSFALIVIDMDAPADRKLVNREDVTVPLDYPRGDFYHWVVVDIPAHIREIQDGEDSSGVTARGKNAGKRDYGVVGINDYTGWFAGDESMEGFYAGYDGPCPPWNDEKIHRYTFRIYALDLDSLVLNGNFTGADVLEAMKGHILAQSEWSGTYTLTPALM